MHTKFITVVALVAAFAMPAVASTHATGAHGALVHSSHGALVHSSHGALAHSSHGAIAHSSHGATMSHSGAALTKTH